MLSQTSPGSHAPSPARSLLSSLGWFWAFLSGLQLIFKASATDPKAALGFHSLLVKEA